MYSSILKWMIEVVINYTHQFMQLPFWLQIFSVACMAFVVVVFVFVVKELVTSYSGRDAK